MHHIFGDAMGYYHLIASNPVTKRDRPTVIRVEQKHLKPAEAKKLLANSRDRYIGPAVWLATLGALRPNEVQALRFDAINFDRNVIEVRAGFKRKVNKLEPFPKGRRAGEVPMPKPLRELLLKLSAGKKPDDFVIPGVRGEMLSYGTFHKHLAQLLQEFDLPLVSPHKLRHSATELWIEHGATEEDLIRLLNHSGAGAVRHYIHRSSERLHSLASKIDVVPKPAERRPLALVR
jgi:integrase